MQQKSLCLIFPITFHPYHQLLLLLLSHQSCQTLCDPIDNSPPGSSVPGILQARILEWVAISFSNHQVTLILKDILRHITLDAAAIKLNCTKMNINLI